MIQAVEFSMQQNNLVDTVRNWVQLDNQIRFAQKKLKELRDQKKQKNEEMIRIMKENEIDNFDLKDGQIRYKKEKKRETLTQKKLLNILLSHPQLGKNQAEQLNHFVFESRKVVENETITRRVDEEP